MSFLFISEDMTEWSASQGDRLMSDSEEDVCLAASRRADQKETIRCFEQTFK